MSVSRYKKNERKYIAQIYQERQKKESNKGIWLINIFVWLMTCMMWVILVGFALYLLTLITDQIKFSLVFSVVIGVGIGSYSLWREKM